ncbi:hypothetical protein Sden_2442 [Shewanella denitrificans OS217]|uniref:Uncharacterized protein n=1 Tax=Shewanella denitrificans (strain OS217 / ATCC BAA-1090 / DSM 15013) TaxID=318161 RepID=Q12LF4_SHEDO|nr:hypothetical protein Sden_2442 [Shewanella denitrificans OS217]
MTIYFTFTLLVLVAGLPMGLINTIGGINLLRKYGFKDVPKNMLGRAYGKKPIEILFVGVFILTGSFWYLFIDNGGNLFNFWSELMKLIN